jgi:hypothetical protein
MMRCKPGPPMLCAAVYAQDSIYDSFVEKLAKKVTELRVGNGFDAGMTQAFAAIVARAYQTNSSKADCVAASRVASMPSMGLFAPIGKVDMKSAPGLVRASRTDRRSDRSRP